MHEMFHVHTNINNYVTMYVRMYTLTMYILYHGKYEWL